MRSGTGEASPSSGNDSNRSVNFMAESSHGFYHLRSVGAPRLTPARKNFTSPTQCTPAIGNSKRAGPTSKGTEGTSLATIFLRGEGQKLVAGIHRRREEVHEDSIRGTTKEAGLISIARISPVVSDALCPI